MNGTKPFYGCSVLMQARTGSSDPETAANMVDKSENSCQESPRSKHEGEVIQSMGESGQGSRNHSQEMDCLKMELIGSHCIVYHTVAGEARCRQLKHYTLENIMDCAGIV